MATRKGRGFKVAFVLDEPALRQIDTLVRKVSNEVRYTLFCSDDSSVDYASVEEVLRFPNADTRHIKGLDVESGLEAIPRVALRFRSAAFDPVSYEVVGDEEIVFRIAQQIEDLFFQSRQWYSPLAFLDFTTGLPIFVIVVTTVTLPVILGWIPLSDSDTSTKLPRGVLLLLLSTPFAVIFLGNRLMRWLFPVAGFAIGHGLRRHESVVWWRRTLGVGVLLAVAVSVIASFVYRAISQ